jgi:quinol monooxygenase YgiN
MPIYTGIIVVCIIMRFNFQVKKIIMDKVALLVRLQAKEGKEQEVEKLLRDSLPDVEKESATSTWHALYIAPSTYVIFDTFPDGEKRESHFTGKVIRAIEEKSPELLAYPPIVEKLDIISVKMPEVLQY